MYQSSSKLKQFEGLPKVNSANSPVTGEAPSNAEVCRASALFRDIGFGEDQSSDLARVWSDDLNRSIYFAITSASTVKQLSECLDCSEPTTRAHVKKLTQVGLLFPANDSQPISYDVSVGPFLQMSEVSPDCVAGINDYFLSFNPNRPVSSHYNVETTRHELLANVSRAFSSQRRIDVFVLMSVLERPISSSELGQHLEELSPGQIQNAIRDLRAVGLVGLPRGAALTYNQREYVARPMPLVSAANDFNEQFAGEQLLTFQDERLLSSITERPKRFYAERLAKFFKAISTEDVYDTLTWFDSRDCNVTAVDRVNALSKSEHRTSEFRRVRNLKSSKVGLLVERQLEGEPTLRTNWKPFRQALFYLANCKLIHEIWADRSGSEVLPSPRH